MTKRDAQQAELAKLEYLLTHIRLLEQISEDWAEGFPASTSGGPQGKGGHSDRTNTEATAGMLDHRWNHDTKDWDTTRIPQREGHGLADQATQALANIAEIKRLIHTTSRTIRHLQPISQGAAEMRTRPDNITPGAGWCIVTACETYCSGALNDKLVTGMCPACTRTWQRRKADDPAASLTVFRNTYTPRAARNVDTTNRDDETAGNPPTATREALPFGQSGVPRPHDAA